MKWNDIKKNPPKSGQQILVYNTEVIGGKMRIRFYIDNKWFDEDGISTEGLFTKEFFTHWQPLPKPPRKENK